MISAFGWYSFCLLRGYKNTEKIKFSLGEFQRDLLVGSGGDGRAINLFVKMKDKKPGERHIWKTDVQITQYFLITS